MDTWPNALSVGWDRAGFSRCPKSVKLIITHSDGRNRLCGTLTYPTPSVYFSFSRMHSPNFAQLRLWRESIFALIKPINNHIKKSSLGTARRNFFDKRLAK